MVHLLGVGGVSFPLDKPALLASQGCNRSVKGTAAVGGLFMYLGTFLLLFRRCTWALHGVVSPIDLGGMNAWVLCEGNMP